MSDFTDSEIEALRLIYEESKKWGKDLRNKVKAGEIDPSKLVNFHEPHKCSWQWARKRQELQ